MIGEWTNHLWQSTLFAAVAGLLTIAFRRHRPDVRYWLWFSASVKFLIPLAWLVNAGSHLPFASAAHTVATQTAPAAVLQASRPFPALWPAGLSPADVTPTADTSLAATLSVVWVCGFLLIAAMRLQTWRRIRRCVRASTPSEIPAVSTSARVRLRAAPGLLEPGVIGWFRPILLLPSGIEDYLTTPQLEAVLAHELCHVRRRDNLTAGIHMVVEMIFWFHPAVWWIGARLLDEREAACDEAVIRLGSSPRVYAEGILTMCRLYVESPLACVAGVTGADLKKRIETILSNRISKTVGLWRKLALGTAVSLVVVLPVGLGVLNTPIIRAQSATGTSLAQTFEVASIKTNRSRDGELNGDVSTGRFAMTYATLRDLVRFAYPRQNGHLRHDAEISGGPNWIGADHFDVVAKLDDMPRGLDAGGESAGAATSSETQAIDRVRLMMRALLADRFKLTVHNEPKELPVFSLSVAGNGTAPGPAFRRVDIDCAALRTAGRTLPVGPGGAHCGGFVSLGPGHSAGHAVPMSMIAGFLEMSVGRNVIDRTGLPGTFDLELHWSPEDQSAGATSPIDPDAPSIFTAVREQLGLKLESTKAPVDVLFIDSAERPTEN